MTKNYADRTIIIYYDTETDTSNPGWVTRCTEHDEHGQPILGRIAMDVQLDAATAVEAQAEAAAHWGCSIDEVARYEGEI